MYKLVLAMNIAEAEIVFIKRLTSTNNKTTKAPMFTLLPIHWLYCLQLDIVIHFASLFATWNCHKFCFVVWNLVLSYILLRVWGHQFYLYDLLIRFWNYSGGQCNLNAWARWAIVREPHEHMGPMLIYVCCVQHVF